MQFYFIRHGQSENNLLWAETGSTQGRNEDPELTDVGWQQAELLAEFLSRPGGPSALPPEYDGQNVTGFGLTHLYCSLMVRAVQTAGVIARVLDLPLAAWQDVHEVGGIHWAENEGEEPRGRPGRNRAFFEEHYPHLGLPEELDEEGWWNKPFETPEQRPQRAARFLRDMLARHGGTEHRVAVVSHGGFYNHLLHAILGLAPEAELWFSINNASLTRIDFTEGGIWLQYTNRVDFLPGELIT